MSLADSGIFTKKGSGKTVLKCAEEASLWEAFMYLDYKAAEQRDQYNEQKKAIEKAKLQSKIKR